MQLSESKRRDNKIRKERLKTLCTLDTNDINLADS